MYSDIEKFTKKLTMWQQRVNECEKKIALNNGRLTRSESWYLEYYRNPYLSLAGDEYLSDRFISHYHNTWRLTAGGQVSPHYGFSNDDGLLGPLFAHMHAEFGSRNGVPNEVLVNANATLNKYSVNDSATGVRLFAGFPDKLDNIIVKFGQKEHLVPMLQGGQLRLTPAGFYKNDGLAKAMQDLEMEREFHEPQFNAVLAGKTSVSVKGHEIKLEDGFLKLPFWCPEYLLWSACLDIDRRMPDDFGANAALIIRNPKAFISRFLTAVKGIWPDIPTWFGPVKYYDPCSFVDIRRRPETIKHFSYYYQQEWRFCTFPEEESTPTEPVMISIGPLEDIAELVKLS